MEKSPYPILNHFFMGTCELDNFDEIEIIIIIIIIIMSSEGYEWNITSLVLLILKRYHYRVPLLPVTYLKDLDAEIESIFYRVLI